MSASVGRAAASNFRPEAAEFKELVGANPEKRNWKGIIIAVLVILIVFALITVAVILVSPDVLAKDDRKLGEKFTLEDMFSREFRPKTFDAKWIGDENVFVYRSKESEVMEYDARDHTTTQIMDNTTFRLCDTETYFVSEDLQYVLIAHKIEKVYRHSFVAEYRIFNRFSNDHATRLIKFPMDLNGSWVNKKLQYAGWSTKGHNLTFVYENNLYYQSDPFTTPTKVTDSGNKTIYNGIPDWLYEEEIFKTQVSHWWSKDSTYICFSEIDDTRVREYTFPWYGDPSSFYGEFNTVAYPKAGDTRENINPVVNLFVINTNNMGIRRQHLKPPQRFRDQEHYVTMVKWQDDMNVLVVWSNRAQNFSIITICNAQTAACTDNLEQKSTGGWVSIESIMFIEQGAAYLTLLPAREGDKGYWKHIAMIHPTGNKKGVQRYITQGEFEVLDIVGYSESTKTIYYTSTGGNPLLRHIYSIDVPKLNQKARPPECLTCSEGDHCQYATGSFSATGEYYILRCEGPGVPQYKLRSTRDRKISTMLEDNKLLESKLRNKALPVEEFIQVQSKEGDKLWVKVLLPPILNKEHITLFPVLMNTYGGPGSQMVTYKFRLGWETYLTSSHNIIYAIADGRGTVGRGDTWLHSIYKKLGTAEVQDQITVAEYLRRLRYVDSDRVGIWGMSYGGFVTAHALGDEHRQVFSCGIAVAPVTDFRYYDTAYTERYLGLANAIENSQGYDNANVSRKAKNFKNSEFMLVHGTADDNVHFQHSAQFIKALTQAEVDFRVQVYVDNKHSLSGPHASRHLYTTMTNFIKDSCWGGANPREYRKGEYFDVDLQLLAIR